MLTLALSLLMAATPQHDATAKPPLQLDLPAGEDPGTTDKATPADPTAEPADTAAAAAAAAATGNAAHRKPGLDTPIGQLIANERTRAVLDRDMPGLSTDENLPKFEQLSLRQFQPLTGGQLSDALLKKVAADLAAAS